MTGISESLCNTATLVQHCDLACTNIKHMKACMRNSLHLYSQDTQMKNMQTQILDTEWVFDIFPAFGFAEPHSKNSSEFFSY